MPRGDVFITHHPAFTRPRSSFRSGIALVGVWLCLTLQSAGAAELRISDDGRTAGYVTLDWSSLPGDDFEVQFEDSQGWVIAYRGPDTATTLTGLDDGTYRFRVRVAGDPAWSDTLEVEVRHHDLGRAVGFFGTGAVMFGILLAALAWPVDGRERNP